MKRNAYRRLLNKNRRNEVQIGSKEDWILHYIDEADQYGEYCWEDRYIGRMLRSELNTCETIDEMEETIVQFSMTSEYYNGQWKWETIKDHYELKDDNRDKVIDYIISIVKDFNYFIRIKSTKNYIEDQIGHNLKYLFTSCYIDKDMFREFKDEFEKLDTKKYNYDIHELDLTPTYYSNDKEKELFYRNVDELKKANIDFKFNTYKINY